MVHLWMQVILAVCGMWAHTIGNGENIGQSEENCGLLTMGMNNLRLGW